MQPEAKCWICQQIYLCASYFFLFWAADKWKWTGIELKMKWQHVRHEITFVSGVPPSSSPSSTTTSSSMNGLQWFFFFCDFLSWFFNPKLKIGPNLCSVIIFSHSRDITFTRTGWRDGWTEGPHENTKPLAKAVEANSLASEDNDLRDVKQKKNSFTKRRE